MMRTACGGYPYVMVSLQIKSLLLYRRTLSLLLKKMYMSVFLLTVIFYDFTPLNLQLNNNKQKRQKLEPGLLISLSELAH